MPAQRPAIRTQSAARKVAHHINGVQAASGFGIQVVNTGLIGDVTCLNAQVHDDGSESQTPESIAQKPQ